MPALEVAPDMEAMSDTQMAEMWRDALRRYKARTGRDIKEDNVTHRLHGLPDLLNKISDSQKHFAEFRGKRAKLWDGLRNAMRPVTVLSSLASTAISGTPFSPVSVVFGSVVYLVGAAEGVSNAYDTTANLLELIGDMVQRVEEYSGSNVDPKLMVIIIEMLCKILEVIARAEQLMKHSRFKKYLKVTFLGSDEDVAKLLSEIEKLSEKEGKMVQALMSSSLNRTEKGVQRAEEGIYEVMNKLKENEKDAKQSKEQESFKKAFKVPACEKVYERHQKLMKERIKDSGAWLFNETLFQSWLDQEFPVLFILGEPGTGKSFLASNIIDRLELLHPQRKNIFPVTSVAYFYIREDNQSVRSVNAILKTITYQMSKNDKIFEKLAMAAAGDPNVAECLSTFEETWKTLFEPYFSSERSQSSAFIVIDGVDEAPPEERANLWKLVDFINLDTISRPQLSRIQIVILGRPEIGIEIDRHSQRWRPTIDVSVARFSEDIQKFILREVRKVRVLADPTISLKRKIRLKKTIVEKLSEGIIGTFVWVKLVLQDIINKSRPSDIEIALEKAPRGLFDMIRHTLERFAADLDSRKDDLNEMLLWVTFARREIKLGEMQFLLKLKEPLGEGLPNLEARLRGIYASFFVLVRTDRKTTEMLQQEMVQTAVEGVEQTAIKDSFDAVDALDDLDEDELAAAEDGDDQDDSARNPYNFASDAESTVIQFQHARIRDYLVREGKLKDLGIGVNENEAHIHITTIGLLLLTDTIPKVDGKDWPEPNLLQYAANDFIYHLAQVNLEITTADDKAKIANLLCMLLTTDSALDRWVSNNDNWYSFMDWFVSDNKFSKVLQAWLVAAEGNISENKEWLEKARHSVPELWRPIVSVTADRWLRGSSWSVEFAAWTLYGWSSIDDDGVLHDPEAFDYTGSWPLHAIPLSNLRNIADLFMFEKDATWHARLARTFRDAGYLDEAVEGFNEALRLDPGFWLALSGLAKTFGAQSKYELAIKTMIQANSTPIPEDAQTILFDNWKNIRDWAQEIDDKEDLVISSDNWYNLNPEDADAMFSLFEALFQSREYQKMLDLAEKLDHEDYQAKEGLSRLVGSIWNNCNYPTLYHMLDAFTELNEADMALSVLSRTITALEKDPGWHSEARLQSCTKAEALLWYKQDQKAAMEIWEDVYAEHEETQPDSDWCWQQAVASSMQNLSQVYFREAMAAEEAGQDPSRWVHKLEGLATVRASDREDGWKRYYTTTSASMVLGLWYSMHGRREDAREFLRPRILEGITILTDDDLSNDHTGWSNLAQTLLCYGDERNAGAAYAIMMKPLDKLKARKRDSELDSSMIAVRDRVEDAQAPDEKEPTSAGSNLLTFDGRLQEKKAMAPSNNRADASECTSSPTDNAMDPSDSTVKPSDNTTNASPNTKNHSDNTTYPSNNPSDIPDDPLTTSPVPTITPPPEEIDITGTAFYHLCDGRCARPPETWTTFHCCEYCIDAQFCDVCFAALKAGTLPRRGRCDPRHRFLRIYPVDEGAAGMAALMRDGKTVPRLEWLEGIRRDWVGGG